MLAESTVLREACQELSCASVRVAECECCSQIKSEKNQEDHLCGETL